MSPNEKNSNSVRTQQNQPEDSFDLNKTMQNLPNSDIANDPKKLKERITDLLKGDTEFSKMKQGDKILVVSAASGLFTAVLPLLAVAATLAIPGAIVGLALYFAVKVAVKTVQSGYKGLKWSAEKTVDGAKYTAGKVRDGAVHVRDSVKEGYEYSVYQLERGASFVNKKARDTKNALAMVLYNDKEGYGDRIDNELVPNSPQKQNRQKIVEDIKAIFADKGNNSKLVKNILDGIASKIDSKITAANIGNFTSYISDESVKLREQMDRWERQKKFVDSLDVDKLRSLVTRSLLSNEDKFFKESIFSEHHDEIKEVIKECKEEHKLSNSIENLNKVARKCGTRKGSMQSIENSLSRSNSLNSIGTESTATVSDSDSQNFATVDPARSRNNFDKFTNGSPKLIPVASPELPRSASLTNLNGQSSFSEDVLSDSTVKQNLDSLSNRTLTRSNSFDSAVGSSGSSTSKRQPVVERLKNSWKQKEEQNPPISTPEVPRSPSIDSGRGSSGSSTPEGQGSSVKELVEQFDPLCKLNSLKNDVSVTDGIELKR